MRLVSYIVARRDTVGYDVFEDNSNVLAAGTDADDDDTSCHLRYQQSTYSVYARFVAKDDSEKNIYLLGRKTQFLVTHLVKDLLRVSDSRIAALRDGYVEGQSQGRTEIQVLSPLTGRVIGARELRVGNDKVAVASLRVKVISGILLTLYPDHDVKDTYVARSAVQSTLTSKYQEGLLDVHLLFSDGTDTALTDVPDSNYLLNVVTKDKGVVEFSSMPYDSFPRVIAVGPGKGDLLRVSVELGDMCLRRRSPPLAATATYVEVDFSKAAAARAYDGGALMELQNDGRFLASNQASVRDDEPFHKYRAIGSAPYTDDEKKPAAAVAAGADGKSAPMRDERRPLLTRSPSFSPLEIGMYVLLGIFCIAIVVFVVNCVVFATRYRRKRVPARDTVSDAPDWVYVGRATLERQSVVIDPGATLIRQSDFNGNAAGGGGGGDIDSGHVTETTSNNNSNRNSTHSYQGSEISIRLTPNPHPSCRSDGGGGGDGVQWDYEAMGLTYDQLKDYFDNLKESNA
ncbi:PREDICTED: transmembrane protein 132E-like [Priapulus caudatus]|uniref:Transmembrane protein 132E-like n=1 Tax=Priapulus caudatus TaxID=37621 RepID=A0ABM1DZ73_PRICU|nr:PREDICTED: transmembrane protein 132E-like [Priapulus caudatus]